MEKVEGIKSVDFKIKALGHGVVNWNGSTEVLTFIRDKWEKTKNHNMPKLRGYSSQKLMKNEQGEEYYTAKKATDIDLKKTPLYISQNCIRHHLFRDEGYIDLQSDEVKDNMEKLLCSITGLVRGYVIPSTEDKRTSALLITDFVDKKHQGNFEQMTRSGSKEKKKTKTGQEKSSTLFSKTTFGDTEYLAYGSISIEQLQFISLSDQFSRRAMIVDRNKHGETIAKRLTEYLCSLGATDKAKATYHNNYVRIGSIFNKGEQGILLNDSAINVLVDEFISRLKNLSIRQAKGYMYVDSLEIDFNNDPSPKNMFRIKTKQDAINPVKPSESRYAVYYEARDL